MTLRNRLLLNAITFALWLFVLTAGALYYTHQLGNYAATETPKALKTLSDLQSLRQQFTQFSLHLLQSTHHIYTILPLKTLETP